MKMKLIALAIMASASCGIAHASLNAQDQAIVGGYIAANKGMPQYMIDELYRKDSLQSVKDYIKNNSYYDQTRAVLVHLPALSDNPAQGAVPSQPSTVAMTKVTQNTVEIEANAKGVAENHTDIVHVASVNDSQDNALNEHDARIKANTATIDTKADKTAVLKADTELASRIKTNAAAIDTKADKTAVAKVDAALATHIKINSAGVARNHADIVHVASVNDSQDNALNEHDTRIKTNAAAIDTKADKTAVAKADAALANHIGINSAGVAKNRADIAKVASVNDAQSNVLDEHDARIKANTATIDTKADKTAVLKADTELANRIKTNAAAIDTKADKTAVAKADAALATHIKINSAGVARNHADIANVTSVNDSQDNALNEHDSRIKANTAAIDNKVDKAEIAKADDEIDHNRVGVFANKSAINTETNARVQESAQQEAEITYNASGIKANAVNIAAEQTAITGLAARADDTDTRIAETRAEQQKTNQRVAQNSADIANHEQRITALESSTNSKFADLNKQIDDNRQRASAAISGVAAMANIPQVTDKQEFSVGAGVGTTDGESALAVGFSARATEHVVVKASVSNDTQQNFVIGGGVSYGW